jgi:DNA-directed RNA polymerase subunit L
MSDNYKEFFFENEDTTLVGILQEYLLKRSEVEYAAYIQKHPLEHNIILKVITRDDADPELILIECIKEIIDTLNKLRTSVTSNSLSE